MLIFGTGGVMGNVRFLRIEEADGIRNGEKGLPWGEELARDLV